MFRDVPGCSGMFRNVPACSGMFHVPGFIDGHLHMENQSSVTEWQELFFSYKSL